MSYNRFFQFGSQVLSGKMGKRSIMKNDDATDKCTEQTIWEKELYIYRNQEAYVYEVQKGHDRPIYIKAQYTAKIR